MLRCGLSLDNLLGGAWDIRARLCLGPSSCEACCASCTDGCIAARGACCAGRGCEGVLEPTLVRCVWAGDIGDCCEPWCDGSGLVAKGVAGRDTAVVVLCSSRSSGMSS